MSAAPPSVPLAALLDHPLLREGRLWQAGSLGRCQSRTFSSGFEALDAELPGGGWPSQSLCEILQPAGQHAEWRLLAPALRRLFAPDPTDGSTGGAPVGHSAPDGSAKDTAPIESNGSSGSSSSSGSSRSSTHGSASSRFTGSNASAMPPILLIAPPFVPHGPGLLDLGLDAAQWVWIKATPEPYGTGPGDTEMAASQGRGGKHLGAHHGTDHGTDHGTPRGDHQGARQGVQPGLRQGAHPAASDGPFEARHEERHEERQEGRHEGLHEPWHEALHETRHEALHEALRQRLPPGAPLASLQESPQRSRQNLRQGAHRGTPPTRPPRSQQALHQALWVAEQAIKSQAAGAVLAWLDGAQPEQIRRLQAAALNSPVPIFLMRPDSAASQSSAAPLRLRLSQPAASRGLAPGLLEVLLIKRRGPAMVHPLQLHSLPPRLQQSLPARLRQGVAPPQPPTHAAEPARAQPASGLLSSQAWSSTPQVEA